MKTKKRIGYSIGAFAAVVVLVSIGMSAALIYNIKLEIKNRYAPEAASYAHTPSKGKGK